MFDSKNISEKVQFSDFEDANLYMFISKSLNREIPDKYQYMISGHISDRLAADIEKLVGFPVKGYKNKITPGRIRHIYNRHGKDGVADNSLADTHNIARIGYVVENYDNIVVGQELSEEFKNSDGSPAKTILLQKNIGKEYYYIVEAVPDSSSKTLFVVSAFINKNDTYIEAGNAISPNPDVQNELQSNVSFDNIIS